MDLDRQGYPERSNICVFDVQIGIRGIIIGRHSKQMLVIAKLVNVSPTPVILPQE